MLLELLHVNGTEPVLFCWSGGKDSAMALHALRHQGANIVALLTTVTEGYDRISMHGVRRELLRAQTHAIGIPLHEVPIPPQCINPIYESRMAAALREFLDRGVRSVAFGDIFLEDLRDYRERNLASLDMKAVFPIWKQATHELANEFIAMGFRAVTACVDPARLPSSFAGRELDASFFRDLPPDVDPCGENGEFHTFVYDGPIFRQPLRIVRGQLVTRDGFVFNDFLPAPLVEPAPLFASHRA